MISWMQKHRKYLVVTIWISTIAFVGAGFVGWGAYSYNSDRANTIAKVGNEKITQSDLQSAYTNLYNYYNQMLGGQLTKEKAQELHLQDIAVNQLIQQALLLNYAKEHGIVALDSEVIERLQSIDAFKANGIFSKEQYFQVLRSIGTNAKEFEVNIKKEIVIDKLKELLALPATDTETKMLYAASFMEDLLALKTISTDESEIKISDKELKDFWEKNKQKYLTPKTYVLESIEVAASTISVDDEELKSYYNEHKGLFKDSDEKILPFEKAKEQVLKRVQKKKAKTQALKEYLSFKNGKREAQRTIEIAETNNSIPLAKIRKLSIGEFAKSIELPTGYMTAKLVKIIQPAPMTFEKAKEMAKKELQNQKRYTLLESKAKNALKDLSDLKEIGFVSRDDLDKITMLNKNEAMQLLNHIFSTPSKEGYYLFNNKAIVYEIKEQKLFDKEKFANKKDDIAKSVEALKNNSVEKALMQKLQKKYKIEKYFKG